MKSKFLVVILGLSLLFNAALLYMFNQKNTESEHRLNVLYMAYEEGLYTNSHLINAMNGFGKEHLLKAYADLHSSSRSFRYFKPQIGIRSDDYVITFYSDLLLKWLAQDYAPTEEEYKNMIDDIAHIYDTFSKWEETPGKYKERSIFDWNEDEYLANVDELRDKLILFNE